MPSSDLLLMAQCSTGNVTAETGKKEGVLIYGFFQVIGETTVFSAILVSIIVLIFMF